MRRLQSLVLAFVLTTAAAACGDDSNDPGDTVTIAMRDNSFDPASRTIDAGTTVRWVNEGSNSHNTTSGTGLWQSANLANSQSFERTFSTTGTFDYSCTLHQGMNGTITVQ